MVQKEDRRIKRTKKMLKNALAELMLEKDFQNITVKDITDRADLNRGTFYLHYTDTYDLLEKIQNELIQTLKEMIENYQPTEENHSAFLIIDQVFDFIEENKEICIAMFLSSYSNTYLNKLIDVIKEKGFQVKEHLHVELTPAQTQYAISFIACGFVGIIEEWFKNNMDASKKEMAEVLDTILLKIFRP